MMGGGGGRVKRRLILREETVIMGILNVYTDSFSDGGKYGQQNPALEHARKMLTDGAKIIDIGGESTRPGYTPVSVEEEIARVVPVIELLAEGTRLCNIN